MYQSLFFPLSFLSLKLISFFLTISSSRAKMFLISCHITIEPRPLAAESREWSDRTTLPCRWRWGSNTAFAPGVGWRRCRNSSMTIGGGSCLQHQPVCFNPGCSCKKKPKKRRRRKGFEDTRGLLFGLGALITLIPLPTAESGKFLILQKEQDMGTWLFSKKPISKFHFSGEASLSARPVRGAQMHFCGAEVETAARRGEAKCGLALFPNRFSPFYLKHVRPFSFGYQVVRPFSALCALSSLQSPPLASSPSIPFPSFPAFGLCFCVCLLFR